MRQPAHGLVRVFLFAAPVAMTPALLATPTGSISSPASGTTVSNLYLTQNGSATVNVVGSAGSTSASFSSWTLYYSQTAPVNWIQLATGTSKVTNAILGPWPTLDAPGGGFNPNGSYQLKLHVCETPSVCTDFFATGIMVQNVYLEQSFATASPQLNLAVPSERATYTLRLPLTWPTSLSVTISLKNQAGTYVKSVGTTTTASSFVYAWDGTNTGGTKVPDGPHFAIGTATDGTNSLTWDQTLQYRDDYQAYSYYDDTQTWDPFTGDNLDIGYSFDTGRITITISSSTSDEIPNTCPPPSGFCLVDHKYEESGPHIVKWAGADLNGKYRADMRRLAIVTERNQFSKNAVVVYGGKPTISNLQIGPRIVKTSTNQTVTFSVTSTSTWTAQLAIANQESGTILRTVSGAGQCINGACVIGWNGQADNGMWVAPGGYTITATVTDTRGNVVSAETLAYIQY